MIHTVDAMSDTLNKICMHYNVNKGMVQNINDIRGDEIYMLREILIPCNDASEMYKRGPMIVYKTENQK